MNSSSSPISSFAGISGIYLFAAFAWLSTSLASLGLAITLLAFLFQLPRAATALARTPAFWALAACLIYILINSSLHAWANPAHADAIASTSTSYAQLLIFIIPVAWFLFASQKRVLQILALAALGLLGRLLYHTQWDNPINTYFGASHGFGMAQIGLALYLATGLLGLAIFLPRIFSSSTTTHRRATMIFLTTIPLIFFTQALIVTQSRATWLAFIFVTPLTLIFFFRHRLHSPSIKLLIIAILLPVGLILMLNGDAITKRAQQESSTIASIISLDGDNVPASSLGLRYHSNVYGLTLIQQNPLWGFGAGSTNRLIDDHYLPEARSLQHFHNTYLQITSEFGIVGLLFAMTAAIIIAASLRRLNGNGSIPQDIYLFIFGSMAMLLIWSISNVRIENWDMRAYCIIVTACVLTFDLHCTRRAAPNKLVTNSSSPEILMPQYQNHYRHQS